MLPFMFYLPSGGWNRIDRVQRANLKSVEAVPTRHRLAMDCRKIRADRATRRWMCPKTIQLWMVTIAFRFPAQYGPGQQCFSPQCD
jgi:hypothetical protein